MTEAMDDRQRALTDGIGMAAAKIATGKLRLKAQAIRPQEDISELLK